MLDRVRRGGRRLLLATIMAVLATIAVAAPASAQEKNGGPGVHVSCWVNVFAWVSTSPSVQGNLSSIISCGTTVQKISQTMYVRDYYTGAIVATVGPVDQFNTTSGGIVYRWYCNQFAPRTLWGEVHGTVTEYSGAVSSGAWGTQALSC